MINNELNKKEYVIHNINRPIKVWELLKKELGKKFGDKISQIFENLIYQLNISLEGIKKLDNKIFNKTKKYTKKDIESAKSLLEEYKITKSKLEEHNKKLKQFHHTKYEKELVNNEQNLDDLNEKKQKIKQLKMLINQLKKLKQKQKKTLEKIDEVDEEYIDDEQN